MNIHEGHRERMRRRFLDHGLDNFDDVNALELLLFYAAPRRDTNATAHKLLEKFGSLDAVLDASAEELTAVEGVGEAAACLLRLIPAVSRRYILAKTPEGESIDTPAAAGHYLVPMFLYEKEESVVAVLLDARHRPIHTQRIAEGVVNAAEVSARKLAELCLARRASAVILAHNHPSGNALPSGEDVRFTESIAAALRLLGVELSDHIIVAGCDFVSLREAGMMEG